MQLNKFLTPQRTPSSKLLYFLSCLRYESHDALDGGKDGLDIIGRVLKVAGQLLKTNGQVFCAFLPSNILCNLRQYTSVFKIKK